VAISPASNAASLCVDIFLPCYEWLLYFYIAIQYLDIQCFYIAKSVFDNGQYKILQFDYI
uniref:hypothetical protein n=1 Tax=Phocaeicola vulgatus TaxID=821 RepID=UPI0040291A21